MIRQARAGIKAQIRVNPSIITVMRTAMIDNGMGVMIPDPYGTQEPSYITCRISHESKGPDETGTSPAGFSTNLGRMILVAHTTEIIAGDRFEWQGKTLEIGAVDPLLFAGKVIAYQAPLKEAK